MRLARSIWACASLQRIDALILQRNDIVEAILRSQRLLKQEVRHLLLGRQGYDVPLGACSRRGSVCGLQVEDTCRPAIDPRSYAASLAETRCA